MGVKMFFRWFHYIKVDEDAEKLIMSGTTVLSKHKQRFSSVSDDTSREGEVYGNSPVFNQMVRISELLQEGSGNRKRVSEVIR
ncbi:hypothetical protein AVEN_175622-1 [Araneus ventricosus]|uniref:Uncharacterized protein n=1 Tax=Araneus ventricosus TaxID=182803 RepID=A0A4Y2KY66_ARAVE|nr:hypothetical protein AVEN_175622-1 [Araneus ventricosus]